MSTGLWILIGIISVTAIGLFSCIIFVQKQLDEPCKGLLIVDHQDRDGPAMVYFQSVADPKTFKNGETIKLKVKIVK